MPDNSKIRVVSREGVITANRHLRRIIKPSGLTRPTGILALPMLPTGTLILIYLFVVLVMTVPLAINVILNLFSFRRPRALIAVDTALPSISVLVPARNEEAVIERCMRSLLRQNYPTFEVVALDDNSSDGTYDVLCHVRDQDPKLRVLAGAALPAGWCGKPHAIWQLAHAARGDYLLLTDADCEFDPDALLFAVGAIAEHKADVISLSPRYEAETFWERLLIPLLSFIPLAFLPIALVRRSRAPVFSGANGSFIFVRRETYLDIDGHRAVRDQLAEDIKFAQHVKRSGKTLWYGDGLRTYRVRMYDSLTAIWMGFTRNLFPAFSGKLPIILCVLVYICLVFVFPPFIALYGWATGAPWALFAVLPYLIVVALRVLIAFALDRDRVEYALFSPLAWAVVFAIAVGSIVKNRKTGADWKGRIYVRGEARSNQVGPDSSKNR